MHPHRPVFINRHWAYICNKVLVGDDDDHLLCRNFLIGKQILHGRKREKCKKTKTAQ